MGKIGRSKAARARLRRPGPRPAQRQGVSGVSISRFCHASESARALLEYVCEGGGAVADGGAGSAGQLTASGREVVAQPASSSAGAAHIKRQEGLLFFCIADCLVVFFLNLPLSGALRLFAFGRRRRVLGDRPGVADPLLVCRPKIVAGEQRGDAEGEADPAGRRKPGERVHASTPPARW